MASAPGNEADEPEPSGEETSVRGAGRALTRNKDEVDEGEAAPRRRGRRRQEDQPEEDDGPARRKRRRERPGPAGTSRHLWLGGAAVAAVLVLAGAGFWLWKRSGPPSVQRGDGVVQAVAVKVPIEKRPAIVERILFAGPGSQQAGICFKNTGGDTYFFERFDTATGKLLSHTDLAGVRVPQQVALSVDGSHLAVLHESAIAVWSLVEGRVVRSGLQPRPANDFKAAVAGMAFLDGNRLLTLTQGGQLTLWGPQGDAAYSVKRDLPRGTLGLREDHSTKQPSNFAWSADHHTLALFNGAGFDILDTATGQVRGQTAALVGRGAEVHGAALDGEAGRLAVHLVVEGEKDDQESVSVYDLKTRQVAGPFRVRTQTGGDKERSSWDAKALSWWGAGHLLLWDSVDSALVLDAGSGEVVRHVIAPLFGRLGYVGPEGRLWYYHLGLSQPKAFLYAVDFPADDVKRYQGLEEGKYYQRWWLTPEGVESQPGANDSRQQTLPHVGPAK